MRDIDSVFEADRELVAVAREIKVLSSLAWDPGLQAEFLAAWPRGTAKLPQVSYPQLDRTATLRKLQSIVDQAQRIDHPLSRYVADTALSYLDAGRLLEHLGKRSMTDYSIAIYGQPGDPLSGGGGITCLDAARYFLDVAEQFYRERPLTESAICIPAEVVKRNLEERLPEVFGKLPIEVVIDPKLVSKAAAGARRIRLRDATCYSEHDPEQLLQHEAFVHSLTAHNGRAQPNLPSLGLGAPRTTATQEGLATLAELVTGAVDVGRLQRIALRIIAIDMALGGASFIDVFRYFLDAGQPESESFSSTMRVFRGAPVEGGAAFTKDGVYMQGLLEVHTFFRWALRHQRLSLCEHLFAGRMTLGDAIRFGAHFDDGSLSPAVYLPPWLTRTALLAGQLAFSVFTSNIELGALDSEHGFESLDLRRGDDP